MAVRLVRGGLQSYDPDQLAKTTIKKGTVTGGKILKGGSSSGGGKSKPKPKPAPMTTKETPTPSAAQVQQERVKNLELGRAALGGKSVPPKFIQIAAQRREQMAEQQRMTTQDGAPTPSADILRGRTPSQKQAILEVYRKGGSVTPSGNIAIPEQTKFGMGRELEQKSFPGQVTDVAKDISGLNFALENVYKPSEKFLSKRVAQPLFYYAGLTPEGIEQIESATRKGIAFQVGRAEKFTGLTPAQRFIFTRPIKQAQAPWDIGFGALESVRSEVTNKPLKYAALTGVGFAGGAVFGGVAKASPTAAKVAGAGLGSVYAVGTGGRLLTRPTPRAFGEELGKIGLEFAAFKTGTKLYKISRVPIRTERITGQIKRGAQLREVQRPYISPEGKELTSTKFQIRMQTIPKRQVTITTKLRKGLGLRPLKQYTLGERSTTVKTLYGEKSFSEYNIALAQLKGGYKGSKVGEFKGVRTGDVKELSPTSRKLTSIQKKLLSEAIEVRVGRPVSPKRIKDVLPKARFIEQIGEVTNFGRLSTNLNKITKLPSPGKTKQLYQTVALIEPGKAGTKGQFFRFTAAAKELKVPTPRASGYSRITTGQVFNIYEPVDLRPSATRFVVPSPIKKTPLSSTFNKQIQQGISGLGISVKPPRVKPIKITPPRTEPLTKTVGELSTISAFTGTGLSERSEVSLARAPQTKQTFRLLPKSEDLTKQTQRVKLSQVTEQTEATRTRTSPRVRQMPQTITTPRLDTVQRPVQRQLPRQDTVQRQRNILRQIFRIGTPIARPGLPGFTPPERPEPKIPSFPKSKGFKLPRAPPRTFTVFGRRFGTFRPVAKARTPGQAIFFGKRWARQTLGATFKIPGISQRKVEGFRTKKTDEGFLFIESRGKRLKRGTREIPEIQLYRGIKRRKSNRII